MMLIAIMFALCSCYGSYWLQKRAKAGEVRLAGKLISLPKRTVVGTLQEAIVRNGEYFAKCHVPGFSGVQVIPIDKAMMSAIPDADANGATKPIRVMLYVESTPNGDVCTLAPEEIRFKTNLKITQDDVSSNVDLEVAAKKVEFKYEIRLVLWTIAWLGIYQAPHISCILSATALFLTWRNIIPLRYLKTGKYGIVKKEEAKTAVKPRSGKKQELPPGYDGWTDERKYLYSLEQKLEEAKAHGYLPDDTGEDMAPSEQAETPDTPAEDDSFPVPLDVEPDDTDEPADESDDVSADEDTDEAESGEGGYSDQEFKDDFLDNDGTDDEPDDVMGEMDIDRLAAEAAHSVEQSEEAQPASADDTPKEKKGGERPDGRRSKRNRRGAKKRNVSDILDETLSP